MLMCAHRMPEWGLNQHLKAQPAGSIMEDRMPSHLLRCATRASPESSFYAPSGLNANGEVVVVVAFDRRQFFVAAAANVIITSQGIV